MKVGWREVRVCDDLAELSEVAAGIFLEAARAAAAENRFLDVALAGGTTPQVLYNVLGSEPFRSAVPWRQVRVFFGDERCVAPEHSDSNFRMAQTALLGKVPLPPENVFRMHGEIQPPAEAAAAYEAQLVSAFALGPGQTPRFGLILLGVGDDGHTASLFPGSPAFEQQDRLVAAPFVEKLGAHRLTLNLSVLNHAQQVVFLVSGSAKAAIVAKVLASPQPDAEFPSQMIQPENGQLLFLLDKAAAADIEDSSETSP